MILFGASGHCKSIIDIAESIGENISVIYDDNPKTEAICHIPVQKLISGINSSKENWIIAVGNNKTRQQIAKRLAENYSQLIHKNANISRWATIDFGTVIMANALVNAYVTIGKHCIINSAAVIEHDCIVGDFAHISPNATLAGGVVVGEGSHIGMGACILPEIKIGKWCTVGAGAIVTKNVPDGTVVVGNPARKIKENNF